MNTIVMFRMISIGTVGATAIAVAAILMSWDCAEPSPWECATTEKIAAIVTTLSLTIAPCLYFARRLHYDMTEGQRASMSLYMELQDTIQGLDSNKHPDLRVVSIQDRPVYFMSRLLNHDVYDSLVNSGKITFIDVELQQSIQDVFQRVKDHNMALRNIRVMQESNMTPSSAYHLYRRLEDLEHVLLDNIPRIMQDLEKKYTIPDSVKLS